AGRVNSYRALLEPLGAPHFKAVLGLPEEGGVTSAIDFFQVDVATVFDPGSVMDPANWEMRGAGPDGLFNTEDDVLVPVTLTTNYMVGSNRLSFILGYALPPDQYQFRAYSGGLVDPFGTPLDGDGDGAPGGNFVRNFTVLDRDGIAPQARFAVV